MDKFCKEQKNLKNFMNFEKFKKERKLKEKNNFKSLNESIFNFDNKSQQKNQSCMCLPE